MIAPFDAARPRLERQYLDARFNPASGFPKEELVAELERHRAENPDEPRILTRAWLLHLLCSKARLAPEPDDYFVGKLEHHDLPVALRREWWKEAGDREFGGALPGVPGAWSAQLDCASHVCPDWANLLKHGAAGLRDRAAARARARTEIVQELDSCTRQSRGVALPGTPRSSVGRGLGSTTAPAQLRPGVQLPDEMPSRGWPGTAPDQSGFHHAVAMVLDGVVALLKRFNKVQPSPVLAALAERPPETLHEALQLAYLYHELMELDGVQVRSMGRFDLLYNDFYLADLRAGRLTRHGAKELLKYFWIKFFAKTQGKLFGKPFVFGPDANEFSHLAFEAYREMRIEDPKFHVRVAEHTPPDFLEKVVRCLLDGCNSMVLVNNDAQVEMLRRHGKTPEDAEDYILIGCYEAAVQGKELNCSGAAALNLASGVERALASGDHASFAALKDAYFQVLDTDFTEIAESVRRWERLWPEISPTPLLSGTMDSCVEHGLDISEAGADYNTSGCCCHGLADAVDSLAVVEQLVYGDNLCSLAELKAALAANWDGFEELRFAARHRVPKWGNDDDRVDRFAEEITNFLGERMNREPNARGGVFQAALYGILPMVQQFGKHTGALPNGRRAGEPLTVNTGATVGMDANGVTSLINSVTKIDLAQFPNGTVLDVMLHPSALDGGKGTETLLSLVKSHFAQGGMAIQFNVLDADTLRDAQRNPERHANLQVRVCGWSVRFVNLRPEEQDLFIAKAEALR